MTFQQLLELRRKRLLQGRQAQPRTGPFENRFGPPSVPPQTWGGLLTSMGGHEDRLDSMPPTTETTTVIKESLDPEVATTKTTTIKGDPNFQKMLPGQDMGMIDPSWSGATAVNRPPPTNLPGTDFFGGEPTAPQPTARELIAATQSEMEKAGWPDPQDHVAVGGVGSRLTKLLPRRAQAAAHRARMRNIANYKAQQDMAKKAMIAGTIGAGGYAGMELAKRMPDQDFQTPRQQIQGGRPTSRFPQEVLDQERISVPPPGGRSGPLSPEVIEAARERMRNRQSPFPNRFPEEVLDRRKGIQQTPFRGEGEASSRVAMPLADRSIDTGKYPDNYPDQASGALPKINNAGGADAAAMRNNPDLERIWGKYAYDPAARKKAYLDNLKKIYRKAMLLDAIAALTGGESRSRQYLEMATSRLNEIDKFDEEERISNIWREVFTNDEGGFDMPASKAEAGRRAAQLGASPKTIKDIFGSISEEKKRDQYFRVDPKDPNKWDIKRFDSDPGEEWIRGTPTATSPVKDKSTYHIKNLRHWEKLKETDPELADSFGRQIGAIPRDKTITPSKWASIIAQDIANDRIQLPEGMTGTEFIQQFLTQDEVEYIDSDQNRKTMPGYNKWTGQQATKDEVESAVKESGGDKEKGTAPQAAIDALMANPTEEMKKMFKDKYGYLPEGI